MNKGGKKWLGIWIVVCLFAGMLPGTALGAAKSVTSVTIRVGTEVEAGDHLASITTYDDTNTHTGTYAGAGNSKYYIRDAEWVTSTSTYMSIGDEPKMRIYLYIGDDDYAFRGTYSSSNVSVKGGTFVSAARKSLDELQIVVKLNGIKGEYAVPEDASWKNSGYGKAVWNQDVNDKEEDYYKSTTSGYYDVILYRGGSLVKKLESYKGTSYDFYPYMTREGTYTYKVRTVPYTEEQKKYGTKSGWLESDEIYIDKEHVSDGTGQTSGTTGAGGASTGRVGWIQDGDTWYYKYPDGTYQKNSWLKVADIWYLFDADGRMLTGWQTKDGLTYYLQANGALYTGWIREGNSWYYLNTLSDGGVEGAMRTGWLTWNGKTYCLSSSGAMLEGWNQVDGNWYYFYPGYGYKAVNTTIDSFYVDNNGIWKK